MIDFLTLPEAQLRLSVDFGSKQRYSYFEAYSSPIGDLALVIRFLSYNG